MQPKKFGRVNGFLRGRQVVALEVFGERNTSRLDVVDVLYNDGHRIVFTMRVPSCAMTAATRDHLVVKVVEHDRADDDRRIDTVLANRLGKFRKSLRIEVCPGVAAELDTLEGNSKL